MIKINQYILDDNWFRGHQKLIKFVLNLPGISYWFNKKYNFRGKGKFIGMGPNRVGYVKKKPDGNYERQVIYYPRNVWSKEIVKYFWWYFTILHCLDLIIDRIAPDYSFGFQDFFTPQRGQRGSNTTTDASLEHKPIQGMLWGGIRLYPNADGRLFLSEGNLLKATVHHGITGSNLWLAWARSYISFDTTTRNVVKTVDKYDLEIYITGKTDRDGRWMTGHVEWYPAFNANIVAKADYDKKHLNLYGSVWDYNGNVDDFPRWWSLAKSTQDNLDDTWNYVVNHDEVLKHIGGVVPISVIPFSEHQDPWGGPYQNKKAENGIYFSSSEAGPEYAPRFTVYDVVGSSNKIIMIV